MTKELFSLPPDLPPASDPSAWMVDAAMSTEEGAQLRHVLPAVLEAVGVSLAPPTGTEARASGPGPLRLPAADRAVVVLVDGLGVHNLALRAGHAPFLRRLLHSSPNDPDTGLPSVRTCAPSTTAAAVTTFGTGLLPGEHGMVGYEVRDPASGAPISLISWAGASLTPRGVQEQPTLAERAVRAGHTEALTAITPAAFVGTGLTQAALRGWAPRTAETLADRVDATLDALTEGTTRVAYLYWGEVDHIGHGAGWASDQWVAELERVDAELARLARLLTALPGDTLLVVTADHGMLDVTTRHDLTAEPDLLRDVAVVAGDLRAPQLHLDARGAHAAPPELTSEVAQRWREHFTAREVPHLILTRSDLEGGAPLGSLGRSARGLVGDVIAFLGGGDVVVDPRTQSANYRSMPGVHGSLSAQELYVPLLTEIL